MFIPTNLKAQQEQPENKFYDGISTRSGIRYTAIIDEFISQEKYSGTSPFFIIDWSKDHETYKFNLSFDILSSAKVKNYSMSAQITELAFNLSYLYPISDINIYDKKFQFFFGPMPEFYLHYRRENIAGGGSAMLDTYSFGLLISLGPRLNALLPLNESFLLEGNICSNLIGLGGKFVDPKDKKISMIKLQTIFSSQRVSFDAVVKYKLLNYLSASAGYKFYLTRMNSWDYFICANDNFIISLTYLF